MRMSIYTKTHICSCTYTDMKDTQRLYRDTNTYKNKPRQQPAARQVEVDGFGIFSKCLILNSKFEIFNPKI